MAGAHVVTPRRAYLHHGIYVGNGQVVHYAGLVDLLRRGPVEVTSLDAFTQGYALWVASERAARFTPSEVVQRAMSRLGEDRYHLFRNNCEHFCEWCLHAEVKSYQIDRWIRPPRYVVLAIGRLLSSLADRYAPARARDFNVSR